MTSNALPPEFLKRLKKITARRARIVIDHLLEHGQITSEDLKDIYGYNHPPRAIRDVRERGIPIETFWTTSSDGRRIAAYRFGNPDDVREGRMSGRKVFSKAFKAQLVQKQNNHCAICNTRYEPRYLQIDHCVPYEVSGDDVERKVEAYMLLCTSCNRAKSWSCEHCVNWQEAKDSVVCLTCYWASPTDYTHVATLEERRISLVWQGDEIADYERMRLETDSPDEAIQGYIKKLVKNRHQK